MERCLPPPDHGEPQANDALEHFDPGRDLVTVIPMRADKLGRLRRGVIGKVLGAYWKKDGLQFMRRVTADGWSAYFDTFTDPLVAKTASAAGGHKHALERIAKTLGFSMAASFLNLKSPKLTQVITRINLLHGDMHIVEPDGHGGYEVTPEFEDSFRYVIAAIIERLRDGLERRGIPRESEEGRRTAWELCQVWYQLGEKLGLKRMPKDLDANDRFVRTHEARVHEEFRRDPRAQEKAREAAPQALPAMSATSKLPVEDIVKEHVRPEVAKMLGISDPEVLRKAQDSADKIEATRLSPIQQMRRLGRFLLHALVGEPESLRILKRAEEELMAANDPSWRLIGPLLSYLREHLECTLQTRTVGLTRREPIIKQGDTVASVFIVLPSPRASLEVQIDGASVAEIARPTLIGEMGLLRGKKASATVTPNKGQSRLVEVTADQFRALQEYPLFKKALRTLVQIREKQNEAKRNGNGNGNGEKKA